MAKQLVPLPKDSGVHKYAQLGYFEVTDEGLPKPTVAFLVYSHSTDKVREVMIKTNGITGNTTSVEKADELCRDALRRGLAEVKLSVPVDSPPRHISYELVHKEGVPAAMRIRAIVRNKDGSAKDPETFDVAWPFEPLAPIKNPVLFSGPIPLVQLPKSSPGHQYQEVGYCEVFDALITPNKGFYAFLVAVHTPSNGKKEVTIKGCATTGTYWSEEKAKKLCQEAKARGEPWSTHGEPFTKAGPDDQRKIEFRLHHDGADDPSPSKIEINITTRRADGSAEGPHSFAWDWPL